MYLQFAGKEYAEKEILQMVKNVWTKELRNKVGDMKEVQIYLKPEEGNRFKPCDIGAFRPFSPLYADVDEL